VQQDEENTTHKFSRENYKATERNKPSTNNRG